MSSALKYIIDDKGHKTSVLVPVKTWDELNDNLKKLSKKLTILTGIQEGFKEVSYSKAKGIKLQTLADFLSESDS